MRKHNSFILDAVPFGTAFLFYEYDEVDGQTF